MNLNIKTRSKQALGCHSGWFGVGLTIVAALTTATTLNLIDDSYAARANAPGVEVLKSKAVSEFPEGIRFYLEARSTNKIEEVRVWFIIAGTQAKQYNYLDIKNNPVSEGGLITGEYFHRTNSRDRYSPPGTKITYWFELFLENGDSAETDQAELIFTDTRFVWETIESGPITVFYHGPVEVRAKSMASAAFNTIKFMGEILGADKETPVRITMYNNVAEMLGAFAPRSSTISRELITEGQAFSTQNVVLVLGSGRRATGTISHELTHILVHRAAGGSSLPIPLWLNEGLAEFGNVDQSLSYHRFLEWAVDTERLIPFESLDAFPGDPNLAIVAYGQSRSIVEYIISKWGPKKMAELFQAYREKGDFEDAFKQTYGLTVREIDNEWRSSVDAAPLEDIDAPVVLPTVEPTREALKPYTLGSIRETKSNPTNIPQTDSEIDIDCCVDSKTDIPKSEMANNGSCSSIKRDRAKHDVAMSGSFLIPVALLLMLRPWNHRRRFFKSIHRPFSLNQTWE